MTVKRSLILIFRAGIGVLLLAGWSAAQTANPVPPPSNKEAGDPSQIPKEPGWKHPAYRGWEVISIPGLIATYYDLDLDGQLDYAVIRKVIRKAAAEELTIQEAIRIARFDHMALYVSHPIMYFTNRHPLFYCRGLDFRKNCQNIWVDIGEDGLNGNETLYTLTQPALPVR